MTSRVPRSDTEVMAERILMIDDEATILFALSDYFGLQGYRVDTAMDRETAEAFLAKRDYDLVIVDLRLRGWHSLDGLEIVRFVRAQRQIPAVLLTGDSSPELVTAAKEAGAAAVLSKTMGLKTVERMVSNLIATRQQAPASCCSCES